MRTATLCLLALASLHLMAQQDKIYLKNGSLLKGIITNEFIEDTISLEVGGASLLVPLCTIDEIYPHSSHNPDLKRTNKPNDQLLSTAIGMGVITGKTSDHAAADIRPSVHLLQTVHLHHLVNPGIQVEWVSFHKYNLFPFTLNYQAFFGRTYRSWLAYANLGYGYPTRLKDHPEVLELKGGFTYQLGIGWQMTEGNSTFQFRMGYLFQKLEETQEINTDYLILRKRTLNRITLQVVYQLKYGK